MQITEHHKSQSPIKTQQFPASGNQARIAVGTKGFQRTEPVSSLDLKENSIYNRDVNSSEKPKKTLNLSINGENTLDIWKQDILKHITTSVAQYNQTVDSSDRFELWNESRSRITNKHASNVTKFISWVLMPKIGRKTKNPFSNKAIIFAHSLKDRIWTIKFILIYLKNLLSQSRQQKLIYACGFIQSLLMKEKKYMQLLQSKEYMKFETTKEYKQFHNDYIRFKSILQDSMLLFGDVAVEVAKDKPASMKALKHPHIQPAQNLAFNCKHAAWVFLKSQLFEDFHTR